MNLLNEIPISDLPDYLFQLLQKPVAPPAIPAKYQPPDIHHPYILKAVEASCALVKNAQAGSRNDALNREAFAIGTLVGAGALDYNTAKDQLLYAAGHIGLGATEATKTIDSGLKSGIAKPRNLDFLNKKAPPTKQGTSVIISEEKEIEEITKEFPHPTIPLNGIATLGSYYLTHTPFEPPEGEKALPNDVAKYILNRHDLLTTDEGMTFEYNGHYWEEITKLALESMITAYETPQRTSDRRCKEISSFVRRVSRRKNIVWRNLQLYEVPFLNGVLDMKLWTLRPHCQHDYLETVLPMPFDETAVCPVWKQCLADWFGKDDDGDEKILCLQEFFGYILMPHAYYKRSLLLQGEPNTGKSQILAVIREMVGEHNTCSIEIEEMDDAHAVAQIVGKMVNLLDELASGALLKDRGFKRLVSAMSSIAINEKFKPVFNYTPFAKHIIATNTMPHINDQSDATIERILLIQCNHQVKKINRYLIEDLKKEMKGIALWAALGAERLYSQKGEWTYLASSDEALKVHKEQTNDFNSFLAECTIPNEAAFVKVSEVCKAYNMWKGGKPVSTFSLGKKARGSVARLESVQKRDPITGQNLRVYFGFTLKD